MVSVILVSASSPFSLSAGGEFHSGLPERLTHHAVRAAPEPADSQGERAREPAEAAGRADGHLPGPAAGPRAPGRTPRAAVRGVRGPHPPAQLPENTASQPGAGAQGAGGEVCAGGAGSPGFLSPPLLCAPRVSSWPAASHCPGHRNFPKGR